MELVLCSSPCIGELTRLASLQRTDCAAVSRDNESTMLWHAKSVLLVCRSLASPLRLVLVLLWMKVEKPKLLTYDYGFQAEFLRSGPSVPHNVFKLAFENFGREYLALRRNLLFEDPGSIPEDASPRRKLAARLGRISLSVLRGIDRILTLYDGLPTVKPAEPVSLPACTSLQLHHSRLSLQLR